MSAADDTPSSIALPHWWGPRQRLKNTLIYHGIRAGLALARVLPLWLLSGLGQLLAFAGFLLPLRERERAIAQLQAAGFDDARDIAFRMYLHFGRLAAEWVKIDSVIPRVVFSEETKQVMRDALAEGHGVLAVAPHLGNWELLAQASAKAGFPCATVAKETYDPRITALLEAFRRKNGVQSLWRSDPAIMHKLIRTLKERGVLGVLIDQDTKVPSIFVPFFGRPASTPVVPQLLAVRNHAAVVFGYAVRERGRYVIHYERVPLPEGNRKQAAEALTADLTARIEAAVRRHPEQWVWVHARWKHQPAPA